jgi:segregation and condensation protein B
VPRLQPPPAEKLKAVLESLLFVAQEPVDVGVLARVLRIETGQVEEAVESLAAECRDRGVRVQRDGLCVQMVTDPEAASYVERLLGMDHQQRLSQAALEVLAIIAYRQPITRAAIDAIRGVNSDRSVATLIGRGLVEETGRANTPGHPALLGTTVRFLEHFGLESPQDLPPLPSDERQGVEEKEP